MSDMDMADYLPDCYQEYGYDDKPRAHEPDLIERLKQENDELRRANAQLFEIFRLAYRDAARVMKLNPNTTTSGVSHEPQA